MARHLGERAAAVGVAGQKRHSADRPGEAAGDGALQLWNPSTQQLIGAPLPTHSNAVSAVAFSANGQLLASASADGDGTVRLWNPATRQPVGAAIQADTVTMIGGGVQPNGQLLASADADGTVRLWKVSLFTHPYAALCADVGPPTAQNWAKYAPREPQPKICS